MVQPINYMSMVPQPDISGSAARLGQQLQRIRGERQAGEALQAYRTDLQSAFQSGKPEDFSALVAKYPQQREALAKSWDLLDTGRKETEFGEAAQLYQALQFNPQVGRQMIDERIAAMENAGEDPAKLTQIKRLAESDPQAASNYIAFTLSSVDPDKWAKMAQEQRASAAAPAELSEQQSKAKKAAVEANFAESNAVADLAKKGWDTEKIANDIEVSKQNAKIAAINAQLKREENALKRQELQNKIEEKKKTREDVIRSKAAEIEAARMGIDNSLTTIDRLLKNPELDDILGSVEGSKFYPSTLVGLLSPIGDSDKRADALADIETIQSQAFLNNLIEAKSKGATFGALTDKEGDRLIGYVRNLQTQQSEGQFRNNLAEIQRLLLKSRKNLSKKHGVPDTLPDRPEVVTTPEEPTGDVPNVPDTSGFRVLGVE